jgi:hypothetical protein
MYPWNLNDKKMKKILISVPTCFIPPHDKNWIESKETWVPLLKNMGYDFIFTASDMSIKSEYEIKGEMFYSRCSDEWDELFIKRVYFLSKWFINQDKYSHIFFIDSDSFVHPDRFNKEIEKIFENFETIDYMGCAAPYNHWNPHVPNLMFIEEKGYFAAGAGFMLSKKSLDLIANNFNFEEYQTITKGSDDLIIGDFLYKKGIKLLHNNSISFESKWRKVIVDPNGIGVPDISDNNCHLFIQHYCNGHMREILSKLNLKTNNDLTIKNKKMINIEITKTYEKTYENMSFKVELDTFTSSIIGNNKNLKVRFCRIGCDDYWEHDINPGVWVVFNTGVNNVCNLQLICDDEVIYEHKFDFLFYGSDLEKFFNLYCKINKNTKGVVVGSHDGTFGHWIFSILDKETSAIIIEGSEDQFLKLKKNYSHLDNCILINQVISKDGKDVIWYKGGEGFTDSIISEVPHKFMNSDQISSEVKQTKTLNEIIEQNNYEDFDWLHTDVEGYDAQLIMSLKYFPKLIIFENMHIKENDDYELLSNFLIEKGYSITDFDLDTLAIRN